MNIAGFDIIIRRHKVERPVTRAPAQYDLDGLGWCIAGECDATLAGGRPMPDGIDYILRPNTSIRHTLEMLRAVQMSAWVIQAGQSGSQVIARARPVFLAGACL